MAASASKILPWVSKRCSLMMQISERTNTQGWITISFRKLSLKILKSICNQLRESQANSSREADSEVFRRWEGSTLILATTNTTTTQYKTWLLRLFKKSMKMGLDKTAGDWIVGNCWTSWTRTETYKGRGRPSWLTIHRPSKGCLTF